MDDPFVIYKEWPIETVKTALEDFKREMYNGADQAELRAGMLCFDYLTRRTDLPQFLSDMIGWTCDEARMRIALMDEYDDAQAQVTHEQALARATKALQYLHDSVRSIDRMMRNCDVDALEYIRQRQLQRK